MTPAQLRYKVTHTESCPHFFSRATMRLFGDSMDNYGVRHTTITTRDGEQGVFELYRKQPVNGGLQSSTFFNDATFEREFSID